jgi:uridine phosphorylase
MKNNVIPPSELIINPDGSVFHLRLRPEDVADTVILVGDPARVALVASYFDVTEMEKANREFVSRTGYAGKKRMTVVSTGIGTDNIDIVMTELDALVNVDFASRTPKPETRRLTVLRLGTSGAIHADIPPGSFLMSDISIGFDGLLNFYEGSEQVCLKDAEEAFVKHMDWGERLATPYFVAASPELTGLFGDGVLHGMTVSAPGFYGPQGRVVRLGLRYPDLLSKLETFRYGDYRICNFEMEGSATAGLARLLGHRAATMCTIIADRRSKHAMTDYGSAMKKMVETAVEKLIRLK